MAKSKSCSLLDLKGLDKIQEKWDVINNRTIEWGYPFADKHSESGELIGNIARWNDQGVRSSEGGWHIPPRPFMEISFIIAQDEMDKYTRQLVLGVEKNTINQALDKIGKDLADTVRDAIGDYSYLANTPSTIRIKNSEIPLIHTSEMFDSATFRIINK